MKISRKTYLMLVLGVEALVVGMAAAATAASATTQEEERPTTRTIGNIQVRYVEAPMTDIVVSADPITSTAQCNADEVVIGGGYVGHIPVEAKMTVSAPVLKENGYQVTVTHTSLIDAEEGFMYAIALCMKPAGAAAEE
jgi:hypothetical protein